MSNIKKKGRESNDAEEKIKKTLSIPSLPQYPLYNRNEEALYENNPTDKMSRQPHQSIKRSENTASR